MENCDMFRYVKHQIVAWAQNYVKWVELSPNHYLIFVSSLANGNSNYKAANVLV